MVNLIHKQWPDPTIRPIKHSLILICIILAGTSNTTAGSSSGYTACATNWGTSQYIEYIAGDLPIIISASHGGYLEPSEIPERTCGDQVETDERTQELTREVSTYIQQETGKCPHIVINKLHRSRLDANRDIGEAACGNSISEQAWREYHDFIDAAKATATTQYGKGLYLDFHSNIDYDGRWVELGFLLYSTDLTKSDTALNASKYKDKSSVKSLAYTPGLYFPEIIRGQTSLGGLLQRQGYKAIPSPAYPDFTSSSDEYLNGGYNTARHGSREGGSVDGIQVESFTEFLQDDMRAAYVQALAESVMTFVETQYGFRFGQPADLPYSTYLPLVRSRSRR